MFKTNTIKTFETIEAEKAIASFKSNRNILLGTAVVTTTTGKQFDANESAQGRMNNAITACNIAGMEDTDTLDWSLANTPSGVATKVTVAELKEAYILAVRKMSEIWLLQGA